MVTHHALRIVANPASREGFPPPFGANKQVKPTRPRVRLPHCATVSRRGRAAYLQAVSPIACAAWSATSGRTVQASTYSVAVKVREIIGRLESDGWQLVRTRGSHRQFRHPSKPGTVTVSGNLGLDVPAGTLGSILKQAGLKKQ